MTVDERRKVAGAALRIARDAAALVARLYEGEIEVSFKAKDDPVTQADHAANALICGALAAEFPGIPIVAEESDPSSYEGYSGASLAWFVDPIDGTRDFVKRNGEFAVMIGLAEEGRSTLGVVVMPAGGRAFVGGVGVPAVEIDAASRETPIRVSAVSSLADAELVVSRSRRKKSLDLAAARFGVRKITPCGSAGVKAARVATGEADVYAQGGPAGKLWDACAPEAIVVAAGGSVSDARGQAFDYRSRQMNNEHGIVITNGLLQARVLELLNQAEREGS